MFMLIFIFDILHNFSLVFIGRGKVQDMKSLLVILVMPALLTLRLVLHLQALFLIFLNTFALKCLF